MNQKIKQLISGTLSEEQRNMTQQQKNNIIKQYCTSLGLPNQNAQYQSWPMPIDTQKQAIADYYVRKTWAQKYQEKYGFDWYMQVLCSRNFGSKRTKEQLDQHVEQKVELIKQKIANGQKPTTSEQRNAQYKARYEEIKSKNAKYKQLNETKKFVLFQVTRQQIETFFKVYHPNLEYKLMENTEILAGINKYKAVKYTMEPAEQDQIPCVNITLCDIYINLIQENL